MIRTQSIPFGVRRVLVTGGLDLSEGAKELWKAFGTALARRTDLQIVTGGRRHSKKRSQQPDTAADLAVFNGMRLYFRDHGREALLRERFVTMLPKGRTTDPAYFVQEPLEPPSGETREQRRFAMVFSCEVVVSIEGDHGTKQILDLATQLGIPVLPFPGGDPSADEAVRAASRQHWQKHVQLEGSHYRIGPFTISEDIARSWEEATGLEAASPLQLEHIADSLARSVDSGITKRCFVIMPYDRKYDAIWKHAIKPAIESRGADPKRLDKLSIPGNIFRTMMDALRHCELFVADLSGNNPNVAYEVGFIHALGKRVVLLWNEDIRDESSQLFFDLRGENTLKYSLTRATSGTDDGTHELKQLRDEIGRGLEALIVK